MGFITNDRCTASLSTVLLEDLIPVSDKCRFIVDIVSGLDLSSLYDSYSSQGGDAYDPGILLGTLFYAYSQATTSSREIEALCRYDLRYIYVSANLKPDHCTISRFRRRHLDLIVDYFIRIVDLSLGLSVELGSEFKEVSIDGSKFLAACSKKHSMKGDRLASKIEKLRERITEYLQRCESADLSDEERQTLSSEVQGLKAGEALLLERQEELEARKLTLKPEHRQNHQINIQEPDARLMPKSDGPSYNAQIAVDSKSGIILVNNVTDDPNDQNQFAVMHQKSEQRIGTDRKRKYNLDSGYHSLAQLEYAQQNNVDAVIADPTPEHRASDSQATCLQTLLAAKRQLQRSDFYFNKDENYYQCPAGERLEAVGKQKTGQKTSVIYETSACQDCVLLQFCLTKKQKKSERKVKRIYRNEKEELAENMARRLKTDEAKARLITRMSTVEPVFGNLKQNLGFRRFRLKGLALVKGEFNLMCIAHNLNMLFNLLGYRLFFSFLTRIEALYIRL